MKKKLHLICLLVLICASIYSQQVGIGTTTPDSSAMLDISNTAKGILIPRMSTAAINNIIQPAKSLMVYDSAKNELMVNMGSGMVPNWKTIASNSSWNVTGNTGTNPALHFIGTLDNKPVQFRMNNKMAGKIDSVSQNTILGYQAGKTTTGPTNAILGFKSLYTNITGSHNAGLGAYTLYSNTTGFYNAALGYNTLNANTTGYGNTAIGSFALKSNTTAEYNVAVGSHALYNNTTGRRNVAIGVSALNLNTTANDLVAIGFEACKANSTGSGNIGIGNSSLVVNTSGFNNIAIGEWALGTSTSGSRNVAIGKYAIWFTSGSSDNTAVGDGAADNAGLGWNNTFLGSNADVWTQGLFNSIAIGQSAIVTASSQTRIGNSSTTSTGGYTGWTNISDGRYKKDVREDVKGLAFIMKLRPVTYHLDVTGLRHTLKESGENLKESGMETAIAEKERMVQSGFIAQEVEQAAMELGYDFSGVDKPKNENDFYGLRYAEFVVPLVKAMQEQQLVIEDLKKQNEDLLRRLDKLESTLSSGN